MLGVNCVGNPISVLDGIFVTIKDDIDCLPHPTKGEYAIHSFMLLITLPDTTELSYSFSFKVEQHGCMRIVLWRRIQQLFQNCALVGQSYLARQICMS